VNSELNIVKCLRVQINSYETTLLRYSVSDIVVSRYLTGVFQNGGERARGAMISGLRHLSTVITRVYLLVAYICSYAPDSQQH